MCELYLQAEEYGCIFPEMPSLLCKDSQLAAAVETAFHGMTWEVVVLGTRSLAVVGI